MDNEQRFYCLANPRDTLVTYSTEEGNDFALMMESEVDDLKVSVFLSDGDAQRLLDQLTQHLLTKLLV